MPDGVFTNTNDWGRLVSVYAFEAYILRASVDILRASVDGNTELNQAVYMFSELPQALANYVKYYFFPEWLETSDSQKKVEDEGGQ